jgi:hypothetical protein
MIHQLPTATGAAMKARRPMPRDQLMFAATLVLLLVLAVILWFKDPRHQDSGPSRIPWPAPAPAKP